MSKPDSEKHKWLLMDWDGTSLRPHSAYDQGLIEDRLRSGATVHVSFKQPRYLPRHRLYWCVIRLVTKNTSVFATEKALHHTLLISCGVIEPVITVDGDIVAMPSSTAFDAMSEDDFQKYFDAALELIQQRIMPDVDLNALIEEAKREARWKEAQKKEAA